MIDHQSPKGWKELQQKVAEIFKEIGYKTEIEKEIKTVRGPVNVDVFSVDETQTPNIVYLCECKHWDRLIPKTIVHAFRTVVQDFGANLGIIISKKGFQRGAHEAARNTNVKLVDWFGFQDLFEEKWLPAISEKLYNEFQALIDYTEPLVPNYVDRKLDQLGKESIPRFLKLRKKYTSIGMTILHLKYGRLYEKPEDRIEFPRVLPVPTDENVSKTTKIHSFREYVNYLVFWGKKGLEEFGKLLDI